MISKRHKLIGICLALILTVSAAAGISAPASVRAEEDWTIETPVLLVGGDQIITGGVYTTENISKEVAYTLDEMKEIDTSEYVYSTINSVTTMSVYSARGTNIKRLLESSGFTDYGAHTIYVAEYNAATRKSGYTTTFDPSVTEPKRRPINQGDPNSSKITSLAEERYFFPYFNQIPPDESDASVVDPIIAWGVWGKRGNAGSQGAPTAYEIPSTAGDPESSMRLVIGQLVPDDVSNPAWVEASLFKVLAGEDISKTELTINNEEYTRGDVLLMQRADYAYSVDGQDIYTRGVPVSVLLKAYDTSSTVTFETALGQTVCDEELTIGDMIDRHYMLAYEEGGSAEEMAPIYEESGRKHGFFTLYGEELEPLAMISEITVTAPPEPDFTESPYKHITNGGKEGTGPYNTETILSETLTIGGPGVENTVTIPLAELEELNEGIARVYYTDTRSGTKTERTYEGVNLYYLLNEMEGDYAVQLNDQAAAIEIINRDGEAIADFTLQQLREADGGSRPIITAYGTSLTDGSHTKPFVRSGDGGSDALVGNTDGYLKLVYDRDEISYDENPDYTRFTNMAAINVVTHQHTWSLDRFDWTQTSDGYTAEAVFACFGCSEIRKAEATVSKTENSEQTTYQASAKFKGKQYKDTKVVKKTVATSPIYRLYNKKTNEHLFTSSSNEYKVLPKYGWTQEGIAWYAPKTGTGVYRLYNPKSHDHHYTSSTNEAKTLTSKYGWTYDNNKKPVFYSGGSVKVYRLYNKKLKIGSHHLTKSLNEYNTLPKYGWKKEGIAFYAVK